MKNRNIHSIFADTRIVPNSTVNKEDVLEGEIPDVVSLEQRVSWGENDLALEDQLANGGNGEGVLIFIADTGLPNHVDIPKPVMAKNRTDDRNISDLNNHSTWINGKISAMDNDIGFQGFSPKADIGIIKVLDNRGSGYMMYEGMKDALEYWKTVRGQYLTAFYSMSYGGGGYSSRVEQLFADMVSVGMIPVAASGNESRPQSSYPALYNDVISIGAYDKNRKQTSFTNYGPSIDYVAPGSGQYSTVNKDQYAVMDGTSMACPTFVACASNFVSSRPNDKWLHNLHGLKDGIEELITDLPGEWDGDGIFEPAKAITRSKYFIF